MYKKIIAVIAVFSLAVWFIPRIESGAVSEFIIKKDGSGKAFLSGYNGKGGAVSIPEDVVSIGSGAFEKNISITKITVPAGCKTIGSKAFEGCVNLKSVIFEGDAFIENSAFFNCTSLESVTFKNRYSEAEIGKRAFVNCFSLNSVNLPENTYLVSEFAFGNCTSLEKITLPPKTFAAKNSIGYMYDEKNKIYFLADGETEAYVSYYELYGGKAAEWYAPKVGSPVVINVFKDSEGEKYAKENGISCAEYTFLSVPKVTAESNADSIILNWNKIGGADAYRVYIYDGTGFKEYKTTLGTMCTVSKLENGKGYKFKVAAMVLFNGKKYSEITCSEEITVSTKEKKTYDKGPSVPKAPNVTANADSDSVTLEWKRVNGADAYRIYIWDGNKNKYVPYAVVTQKSCTVTGLKSGEEYKFKVTSLYSPTGRKKKYIEGNSTGEIIISTSKIIISD